MNVCESLTVTAKLLPSQTALVYGEQKISYQELNQCSMLAAEQLLKSGIQPGDRVALMIPNSPSFAVWYYAALRVGAIAVSVSTRLAPSEVEFIVNDCEAKAFVGGDSLDATFFDNLPGALQVCMKVDEYGQPTNQFEWKLESATHLNTWYCADPSEPALILYTSGTTGFPKGATLSHANVRSNVHAFNHLCNMQTQDRVLLAVPLFHCFGQNALLNSVLNVGGTIILQQRFDINESRRLIAEHQVTQLYGVPVMFDLLLNSCNLEDLASIDYCFSAAATLPIQTGRQWQEKFGMPIYEGYGLTETSPFATYNHRVKFVQGSIGMPIDNVEIRISDTDTGYPCEVGQLGEIAIRGPNVMLGYWNRPEETAEAIRDGWFHSGDIGRLDADGYLYIVDRVKDMITVGGLKVFPAEVERVLLDHPSVAMAAVIGVPDPILGEQVVACVVVDSQNDCTPTLNNVMHHLKIHLGDYKVPRRLIPVQKLPRNSSGKVLKTKLREMAAVTVDAIPVENATDTDVEIDYSIAADNTREGLAAVELISPTLRDKLNSVHASEKLRIATTFLIENTQAIGELNETPSAEDTFVQAGLDSLAMVALSSQLQHEIGPEPTLPPTLLFDYPRVSDLAGFMVETIDSFNPVSKTSSSGNQMVKASGGTEFRQLAVSASDLEENAISLETQIAQLSEEEALDQLMKELE